MKWHLCVLVLIGCLGVIDLHASELSDQAQENSQAADLNSQNTNLDFQAPDLNRRADLRNQPNQWSGRLAAGVIETDNVERTTTDRMSDTIEEITADVALHEQTRRLDADVLSDLQYLHFGHQIYSNEVVGNFIGGATFAILPKQFEWVVQDNFGQQQLDPTIAVTPINLENINYFSTGPNLLIALSPLMHVQLSVRYSNAYYETSDLNNNRGDASVALVRSLSATSNVSLNASAERVLFSDSGLNPDYTTREAYLRYDTEAARSKFAVDLGYDDVKGVSSTSGGAVVHVDASRVLSASSRFDLSVGQEISDTSNLLRQLQGLNGLAVSAAYIQAANDPFINRYARAAWQYDRNRTRISFDVARYQERHLEDFSLNQTRIQTDVSVRRNLAPALAATVGASYAKATYTASAGSYRDLIASAGLEWQLGRHLNLRGEYDRFDQRGEVTTNQYMENRFGITLGWQVNRDR
jgi:Putative beta-barrel porin 2